MRPTSFEIAGRRIGGGAPPYLIAEIGINHGGDVALARKMIDAAGTAGADAVKLQTFDTAQFLSTESEYFEILRSCEVSHADVGKLAGYARELGTVLFSSCFDADSAEALDALGAPMFKVASGDLTHLPLLRHMAALGKPMIVSTGGATLAEIDAAMAAIDSMNPDLPVALLHCVSNYPTEPADANLACMQTMRSRYGCPVGFSDHTLGAASTIAAVALGAEVIEKHFTLDRSMPGPDHALSVDPAGFADLVEGARIAHASIGRSEKAPVESAEFIPLIRRSVTAVVDITVGQTIERNMLAVKRPGTGIAPDDLERLVGRTAIRTVKAEQTLTWPDVGGST